jgi:anti-anti-sigma factor
MLTKYEKFTIHNIRDIFPLLKDKINLQENLIIDMQNINEIDLSGLQLLISLKKSCDKQKKEFELINIKNELINSFELSGTNSILGI